MDQSLFFFEKLIVRHLVKKCPAFYGTRKYISVFTKTPPLLSVLIMMNQVIANQSYVRSFVISSHLYQGLRGGLLPVSTPSRWCFILFFVQVVTFCIREVRQI